MFPRDPRRSIEPALPSSQNPSHTVRTHRKPSRFAWVGARLLRVLSRAQNRIMRRPGLTQRAASRSRIVAVTVELPEPWPEDTPIDDLQQFARMSTGRRDCR